MLNIFKKAGAILALLLAVATSLFTNVNAAPEKPAIRPEIDKLADNLSGEWQNYVDSEYGFQVGYPTYGWTAALAFQNETQNDDVINKRITISNTEFAFINIDIWNNLAGLSIPQWIDAHQKSLLEPGVLIPTSSNVTVGGANGFFIVQPPSLDRQLPGHLITVLQKNGVIYRIEYIAQDGGTAQDIYISILATFEFGTGSTLPDNLPQLSFLDTQAQKQTQHYIPAQSSTTGCCNLSDPQYNPYPCDSSTGNCTWYATYARDDLPYQDQIWGNAKDWITSAINVGYPTGKTPKVSAIVVFQPGTQGVPTGSCSEYPYAGCGHVAYVIKVYNSTSFRVRHMNWGGTCVSEKDFVTGNGVDFIYVPETTPPPSTSFGKTSPANSATLIDDGTLSTIRLLNWSDAQIASTDRYQYCVDETNNNQCDDNNWVTRNSLYTGEGDIHVQAGHNYYWQVRTRDSGLYADGEGNWWSFTVKLPVVTISGNAGIPGATLSYTDGTPKTAIADDNGNYSFTISPGWTGTVTPSMVGYTFSPTSRNYANVTTDKTAQNYTAFVTISGNAGISGATISYTGGTSLIADSNGNYSITVPYNWGGTVTPSKTGYSFDPISKTYSNVLANQTYQNYTALVTISGNAGVGGATLSYMDGTVKSATTLPDGSYSFTVPYNWSGAVTPSHGCFTFSPTNQSYTNIANNQAQNYLPTFNPASGCADINVLSAGANLGRYGIPSATRLYPRYGINTGPMHVISTNGMPMFTSERTKFGDSFNEVMGYPNNQLTTDYWFTSYDDLGMITYLVIGNPSTTNTALVDVYVGGTKINTTPYSIAPGQRIYPRYGINGGPVHVVSTNGTPIFTSERAKTSSSFNEIMGYPGNKLTTDYWFTSYDDLGMITYLVIGNPSTTNTALVDVYIDGVKKNSTPYSIAPGQRIFPRYGINGGPVRVVSTNGTPIFTSERVKFGNSFNEVMGIPANQLTTEFWFTSYDDQGMITYLVIGNPSTTNTALVDVYIGGNKMNTTPYSIAPGQRIYPRYGINGGPVHVVSTNGVLIFTSERAKTTVSFNEIMGFPANQLTTEYWFTSYDDEGMITYLVMATP